MDEYDVSSLDEYENVSYFKSEIDPPLVYTEGNTDFQLQ